MNYVKHLSIALVFVLGSASLCIASGPAHALTKTLKETKTPDSTESILADAAQQPREGVKIEFDETTGVTTCSDTNSKALFIVKDGKLVSINAANSAPVAKRALKGIKSPGGTEYVRGKDGTFVSVNNESK